MPLITAGVLLNPNREGDIGEVLRDLRFAGGSNPPGGKADPSTSRPPDPQKRRIGKSLRALRSVENRSPRRHGGHGVLVPFKFFSVTFVPLWLIFISMGGPQTHKTLRMTEQETDCASALLSL
jgi:hypothetical protein